MEQAGSALKIYRHEVATAAQAACHTQTTQPVSVSIIFTFQRPASHHYTDGRLKLTAPHYPYPAKRGDIDKLVRSTLDAITGPVIRDDAQVIELAASVQYGSTNQVWVALEALDGRNQHTRDESSHSEENADDRSS